jgi:hypothetical protein
MNHDVGILVVVLIFGMPFVIFGIGVVVSVFRRNK